jgi:Phosphopantetheine attachment site
MNAKVDKVHIEERAAALLDVVLASWATALEQDGATPSDDFFEAGGESLSALRLVDGLAVELRLDDDAQEALVVAIFERATPAGIAVFLAEIGVGPVEP